MSGAAELRQTLINKKFNKKRTKAWKCRELAWFSYDKLSPPQTLS